MYDWLMFRFKRFFYVTADIYVHHKICLYVSKKTSTIIGDLDH